MTNKFYEYKRKRPYLFLNTTAIERIQTLMQSEDITIPITKEATGLIKSLTKYLSLQKKEKTSHNFSFTPLLPDKVFLTVMNRVQTLYEIPAFNSVSADLTERLNDAERLLSSKSVNLAVSYLYLISVELFLLLFRYSIKNEKKGRTKEKEEKENKEKIWKAIQNFINHYEWIVNTLIDESIVKVYKHDSQDLISKSFSSEVMNVVIIVNNLDLFNKLNTNNIYVQSYSENVSPNDECLLCFDFKSSNTARSQTQHEINQSNIKSFTREKNVTVLHISLPDETKKTQLKIFKLFKSELFNSELFKSKTEKSSSVTDPQTLDLGPFKIITKNTTISVKYNCILDQLVNSPDISNVIEEYEKGYKIKTLEQSQESLCDLFEYSPSPISQRHTRRNPRIDPISTTIFTTQNPSFTTLTQPFYEMFIYSSVMKYLAKITLGFQWPSIDERDQSTFLKHIYQNQGKETKYHLIVDKDNEALKDLFIQVDNEKEKRKKKK